ncbi:uncharacterized protein BDR25DRAFT_359646 [Lindgomyces ingoldianus]|uniref:Uncharacterized protein n=1 Tax=Lindgomyces ingoldianus TaxID=673940 RepID=A0ACB6QH30_9PLEO|nr:uncharacterized protein BDR25DRAFT_359646 [Lindgomyces ingoldianus]KAF2466278.1 hypothetical protein BDR25DRAFT_359646 [Lindgomyces ingoldianus]
MCGLKVGGEEANPATGAVGWGSTCATRPDLSTLDEYSITSRRCNLVTSQGFMYVTGLGRRSYRSCYDGIREREREGQSPSMMRAYTYRGILHDANISSCRTRECCAASLRTVVHALPAHAPRIRTQPVIKNAPDLRSTADAMTTPPPGQFTVDVSFRQYSSDPGQGRRKSTAGRLRVIGSPRRNIFSCPAVLDVSKPAFSLIQLSWSPDVAVAAVTFRRRTPRTRVKRYQLLLRNDSEGKTLRSR